VKHFKLRHVFNALLLARPQTFADRSIVSRLLLGASDTDKLQQLDDRVTQCLGDMQVPVYRLLLHNNLKTRI
jgi:hypothetical protein